VKLWSWLDRSRANGGFRLILLKISLGRLLPATSGSGSAVVFLPCPGSITNQSLAIYLEADFFNNVGA
jgi:hypothetical protein